MKTRSWLLLFAVGLLSAVVMSGFIGAAQQHAIIAEGTGGPSDGGQDPITRPIPPARLLIAEGAGGPVDSGAGGHTGPISPPRVASA